LRCVLCVRKGKLYVLSCSFSLWPLAESQAGIEILANRGLQIVLISTGPSPISRRVSLEIYSKWKILSLTLLKKRAVCEWERTERSSSCRPALSGKQRCICRRQIFVFRFPFNRPHRQSVCVKLCSISKQQATEGPSNCLIIARCFLACHPCINSRTGLARFPRTGGNAVLHTTHTHAIHAKSAKWKRKNTTTKKKQRQTLRRTVESRIKS